MNNLLLFNKPFNVLCQFSGEEPNLKSFISDSAFRDFYPAGRLDKDSEGLLVLTNDGKLQNLISSPSHKWEKTYWVQVENDIDERALTQLANGVILKDGKTRPAQARKITDPGVWDRNPPIRERKNIPTSWIELKIKEGKNRQVRRMTAAVGFPTLRLIRYAVGEFTIDTLQPGQMSIRSYLSKSLKAKGKAKNAK